MRRRLHLRIAGFVLISLNICGTVFAQASNYQTTIPKARNISSTQMSGFFQNNFNFNGQATNLLSSMYKQNSYNSNASMPSSRPTATFGAPAGAPSKPFDAYSPQPTVSPYLNLFRVDLNGNNDFNYSTLVKPQLQQQQVNQQIQQQALENSRRVQKIAAQADYNPQGSKDEYPTGHQTVFSYTGHYFPAVRTNTKQRAQQ